DPDSVAGLETPVRGGALAAPVGGGMIDAGARMVDHAIAGLQYADREVDFLGVDEQILPEQPGVAEGLAAHDGACGGEGVGVELSAFVRVGGILIDPLIERAGSGV